MAVLSIKSRIFRGVATVSIATTALLFIAVLFAYADLERAMLHLIFAEEETFVLSHLDHLQGKTLETANVSAAHVPNGSSITPPALFSGLPIPYSGEVEHGDKAYIVHVNRVADGALYLAKDVTLFERREWLFRGVLSVIALVALGVGLVLANLTSRRIGQPMSRLADAVRRLAPGSGRSGADFPTDFREKELQEIAQAIARYLDELDAHTRRERRLLAMASHELRTPVAVIAGALDVVDKQGDPAAPTARRALCRIRAATDEMGAQLAAILALSRAPGKTTLAATDMSIVVGGVIDDMDAAGLETQRIVWSRPERPVLAMADPVLAKMLVRNLLHNALQHAGTGRVTVDLNRHGLTVKDSGPGLPDAYKSLLGGAVPTAAPEGAIGLYLVTLIAESLGWRPGVTDTPDGGTSIRLAWERVTVRPPQAPPHLA